MRFYAVRTSLIILLLSISAYSQTPARNPFVPRDLPSTVEFYGPDQNANALREYEAAATTALLLTTGRNLDITSAHRSRSSSPAHADGAIDYRSNNISATHRHTEARELSIALGPKFTVIVEEGYRPNTEIDGLHPVIVTGPFRSLTPYNNGSPGRTQFGKYQATHTHVQRRAGLSAAALVNELGLTPTAGSSQRMNVVMGTEYRIAPVKFPSFRLFPEGFLKDIDKQIAHTVAGYIVQMMNDFKRRTGSYRVDPFTGMMTGGGGGYTASWGTTWTGEGSSRPATPSPQMSPTVPSPPVTTPNPPPTPRPADPPPITIHVKPTPPPKNDGPNVIVSPKP